MNGTLTYWVVVMTLRVVSAVKCTYDCISAISQIRLSPSRHETCLNLLPATQGYVLRSNVVIYSNAMNSSC